MAGARDSLSWGGGRAAAPLSIALGAVVLALGCGGGSKTIGLLDGTAPEPGPRALARLGEDLVMTKTRRLAAQAPSVRGCVRSFGVRVADDAVVQRTSLSGASATFRQAGAPWVLGCDEIRDPFERRRSGPWCGGAAGKTAGGRLLDPRLDLCANRKGKLTAFAWIDPLPDAEWIVVRDGSRREAYAVAGSLPVRVATTHDVFLAGSMALFHVSQYSGDGRRLASSTFNAAVAG